ncbi:MAG: 4Fe-4S binding protein [Candidatus Thiodiazotropha sp.]
MPLKELFDRIRHEEKLPDVVSERCVHELVEVASCTSCVDVCPQRAWSLDDDALNLDTTLCDGCGLCRPACPEDAISIEHEILIGDWGERKIALCACEQAVVPQKIAVVPCIHLVGVKDILKLHRQGYSEWLVATGSCSECSRNRGVKLTERVDRINAALFVNSSAPVSLYRVNSAEWQRTSNLLVEELAISRLSRRGFLRGMLDGGVGAKSAIHKLYESENDPFESPGELMPESGSSSVWPYAPCIDSVRCNGCDACTKLCPHRAIEFNDSGEQPYYRMEPRSCTGCGICVDVCSEDAISVKTCSQIENRDVALVRMKCSSCGNPVHLPAESRLRLQDNCRICAQVNHHKNLYQIVE